MPSPEAQSRRQVLARVPAFAGLRPQELDELAQVSWTKRLPARAELFHKGDEGSQVYIVVSGRLRVATTSADGDDVLFNILDPGEVFGELALLAGGERTATVTAIEDCELVGLDRRDFLPLLRRNPDLAVRLLEIVAERLRRISEFVEDTVFLSLSARLAKKLAALAREYGRETSEGIRIELKVSQQELGHMVGTSRESVNKQLRVWQDAGILENEGGYVTIRRMRSLEALAGSDAS